MRRPIWIKLLAYVLSVLMLFTSMQAFAAEDVSGNNPGSEEASGGEDIGEEDSGEEDADAGDELSDEEEEADVFSEEEMLAAILDGMSLPVGGLEPEEFNIMPEGACPQDYYVILGEDYYDEDGLLREDIALADEELLGDAGRIYDAATFTDTPKDAYSWSKSGTGYFYNQLTKGQKEIWKALEEWCTLCLNSKEDVRDYTSECYYTPTFYADGISDFQEVFRVASLFRYSHPQYFFLKGSYTAYSSGSKKGVCIAIYPRFGKGSNRAAAAKEMQSKIGAFLSKINQGKNDWEKARIAHDLVCENVTYAHSTYDQSAYGGLCEYSTVCAGYAQAYSLLCNLAGIDCISVTSLQHEWNEIRINGKWYVVDCTWDDSEGSLGTYYGENYYYHCLYRYFLVDYATIRGISDYAATHHTIETSPWGYYSVPPCNTASTVAKGLPSWAKVSKSYREYMSGVYYMSPNTVAVAKGTAGAPVISVDSAGKITIKAASGTTVYYTVQPKGKPASKPVGSSDAMKYKGAFTAPSGATIYAQGYREGYLNSKVVSFCNKTFSVKYYANKGSGSMPAQTGKYFGKKVKLKKNTFKRSGYKFSCWNTKKNGSGIYYKDKAEFVLKALNGSSYKLYAQWTPKKYSIVFDANGGKGTMKTKKNCKAGKSIKLSACAFRRTGYVCTGWNTRKDGTGVAYKNGGSVKNPPIAKGKTVRLYAQWKKK